MRQKGLKIDNSMRQHRRERMWSKTFSRKIFRTQFVGGRIIHLESFIVETFLPFTNSLGCVSFSKFSDKNSNNGIENVGDEVDSSKTENKLIFGGVTTNFTRTTLQFNNL